LKPAAFTLSLCSLILLTACGNNNDNGTGMLDGVEPSRVNSPNRYYNEDNRQRNNDSNDFGFVRLNESNATDGGNSDTPTIDREQLADIIGRLTVQLPDVNDAATLVTDDEVLVVYYTDSDNRIQTADQVKRTAASTVPRYFHIYVSDNKALMQNVENFANLGTDSRDVDASIKSTIKEMLKSPQGRNLEPGENANGEMINGENKIDRDNVSERYNK
jgi:hypothetical protein